MQRRKMLAALGSVAVGGATAVSTGAFTNVQAQRNVSVNVADDSDALLAFDASSSTNSAYADTSENAVALDLDGSTGDDITSYNATGVNTDALTQILDIFKVRNQGTQAAVVYVNPSSVPEDQRTQTDGFGIDPQASNRPNGDFTKEETVGDDKISLTHIYDQDFPSSTSYYGGGNDALEEYVLEPGESFDFGLYVDTRSGDFDGSFDMEIVADATIVPDNYEGEGE